MQFSRNWLKDYIALDISIDEICEQLTMAGIEVEDYHQRTSNFSKGDYIIKLDLTPNRGDCFSIRGIARELSVINNIRFITPSYPKIKDTIKFSKNIKSIKEAPIYIGRSIEGLDNSIEAPAFLKERIEFSGLKSINSLVDIMNYVMLEMGQPLHVFDEDKLQGDISVRFAKNNEKITLLDEQTVKLQKDCLIISDPHQPIAFAGIMGSLNSSVDSSTTSAFLESAYFTPDVIRGRARRYGIQTDASVRFERGVDFQLQKIAIERASHLIQENMGGDFSKVKANIRTKDVPKLKSIGFNLVHSNKFLGTEISESDSKRYFKGLGCKIAKGKKHLIVTPPSWRFDLSISEDLSEELARFEGYDNIPNETISEAPIGSLGNSTLNDISNYLVNRGYLETITYSFIDSDKVKLLEICPQPIVLENPLSENMSIMRPSLLTSLVSVFMYNKNRGKEVLKIYEQGKVFNQDAKGNINQESVLAGLIGGANKKPHWLEGLKAVDFYDVKGNVESIYKLVNKEVIFLQDRLKGFHPGKFSYIALKSKPSEVLGYLGSLDPEVMKTLDLQEEVIYFQLNCEQFLDAGDIQFKTFSKYPTSQRDLSFLISKEISSQSLQELIIKKSGKHFAGISVFDVYEGKRIDKGLKSISYNITWRSHKSTLVDEEIERIVENIILGVEKKFSGKIRQ